MINGYYLIDTFFLNKFFQKFIFFVIFISSLPYLFSDKYFTFEFRFESRCGRFESRCEFPVFPVPLSGSNFRCGFPAVRIPVRNPGAGGIPVRIPVREVYDSNPGPIKSTQCRQYGSPPLRRFFATVWSRR